MKIPPPGCHINIHAFWSTKNQMPLISREIEVQLIPFVEKLFPQMKCKGLAVNTMPDHIHVLFWLNPDYSVDSVVKAVRKHSAAFINEKKLCSKPFEWDEEYYSHGVNSLEIPQVTARIRLQKGHHTKMTFEQEAEEHCKKIELFRKFLQEKSLIIQ